jgi:hypothetical protein
LVSFDHNYQLMFVILENQSKRIYEKFQLFINESYLLDNQSKTIFVQYDFQWVKDYRSLLIMYGVEFDMNPF